MSTRVQKIFSEVPRTYELVNHVLTLGLDIIWRRRAARTAAAIGGTANAGLLDVCTGTGETAIYLRRWAPAATRVTAVDFTVRMLKTGMAKKEGAQIRFVLADARRLPFPDDTFEAITISFAARNLNTNRENLLKCFSEFRRVLKPGGRLINLETSQPRSATIRKCFHTYVRLFVRPLGTTISGSKAGYTYLSNTIPRFYDPEELSDILLQAGFSRASYRRRLLGVAAIHQATN